MLLNGKRLHQDQHSQPFWRSVGRTGYQGPAQRFQLVNNRDEKASLIQDQKSEMSFGTAPLSAEELYLVGFATMREKGLSQELNAELTAAEVAKYISEGEKLEVLDKTRGGNRM